MTPPKFSATKAGPFIKALMDRPQTTRDLAELTGFTRRTAHAFCQSLYKEGLIYIAEWKAYQNVPCPAYKFGVGQDSADKWTPTQQRVMKLFQTTTGLLSIPEMRDAIRSTRTRLTPALDDLTEKGYLIEERRGSRRRWRVRPDVAIPGSRNDSRVSNRRPTPVRQTWFSAIS
jgi:DNA-binding MarR family transcriptional regulator